eukprot:6199236-Pleurochrysis_carterae.AAC.1
MHDSIAQFITDGVLAPMLLAFWSLQSQCMLALIVKCARVRGRERRLNARAWPGVAVRANMTCGCACMKVHADALVRVCVCVCFGYAWVCAWAYASPGACARACASAFKPANESDSTLPLAYARMLLGAGAHPVLRKEEGGALQHVARVHVVVEGHVLVALLQLADEADDPGAVEPQLAVQLELVD